MGFVIREQCCCHAAVEIQGDDTDSGQIFAADFVNAWRTSHQHQVVPLTHVEREAAHVSIDALVEPIMGFHRTRGLEVDHG